MIVLFNDPDVSLNETDGSIQFNLYEESADERHS